MTWCAAEVVVQAGPLTTGDAADQDAEAEEMRRYFAHPARLWGFLVLVPFLGSGCPGGSAQREGLRPSMGLRCTGSVAGGDARRWQPCRAVAEPDADGPVEVGQRRAASPAARSALRIRFARAGRIASRSAALCDILFLVALALMIFRP